MKRPAFTFIELMITTLILGFLAVAGSISVQKSRIRATFRGYETEIIHLVQQARSSSLSNLRIGDEDDLGATEEVVHYELLIQEEGITLNAVGDTISKELGVVDLSTDDDVSISTEFEVYYFPPYGEVCFSPSCLDGGLTEQSFTLDSEFSDMYTQVTIDVYGGFPELEELEE